MRAVVATLAALGLVTAWSGQARAQTDAALREAIRSIDPSLRPADGGGTSHRGDFDGDGRIDLAAVVTDGDRSALVVLHAAPDGYRPILLNAHLPAPPFHLRIVSPGRYPVLDPRSPVELSSPAIELVLPGRSSAMYVWEGGRYRVYGTENYASR